MWRYLYEAYQTPAFLETCPSDQDIVKHYEKKAGVKPLKGAPSLQKFTHSYDIPSSVLAKINGGQDGSLSPNASDEMAPEGNGTLHGDD